jgi:hypothetical protein
MSAGITHDLSVLAVDVIENKTWDSLCARFGLKPGSKLADIREAILSRYEKQETDSRVKDTATATLLQFFDALSNYDENVLYRAGKDSTFRDLDRALVENPLPTFLRLHYENILQREEPKLPGPAVQQTIKTVAEQLGTNLAVKLTTRYSQGGAVPRATYLQKATSDAKETQWLIKTVRG